MSHYVVPQHIFFGKEALWEAVGYIARCGSKALIVTGRHVGKSPMCEKLQHVLESEGISYVVFDGITGEPTDEMIGDGLAVYERCRCDFVIGIGGGSPLDSAKAIAAMSVCGGEISDYMGKEISGEVPPIVAVPTTSGTGSEATKFTVITDVKRDVKMLLKGDVLVPRIAVVAPSFCMDMPKSVTVATGLDAFTHAVEAYTSKKAFPMTDTLALSAVRRILTYLPQAVKNGLDCRAREEMALAALEAGICINNSSVTLVHGMSRPIGALFHVPHGLSNAMLLQDCLAFALDGAYEKFAELARAAGVAQNGDSDKEAAGKFLEAVKELCRICEVPTLQAYGVDKEAFYEVIDKMAEDAVASGSPGNTIKTVMKEDCVAIYCQVYP